MSNISNKKHEITCSQGVRLLRDTKDLTNVGKLFLFCFEITVIHRNSIYSSHHNGRCEPVYGSFERKDFGQSFHLIYSGKILFHY